MIRKLIPFLVLFLASISVIGCNDIDIKDLSKKQKNAVKDIMVTNIGSNWLAFDLMYDASITTEITAFWESPTQVHTQFIIRQDIDESSKDIGFSITSNVQGFSSAALLTKIYLTGECEVSSLQLESDSFIKRFLMTNVQKGSISYHRLWKRGEQLPLDLSNRFKDDNEVLKSLFSELNSYIVSEGLCEK